MLARTEWPEFECAGIKTFAYWGQGGTGPTTELPLAQACTHCKPEKLLLQPSEEMRGKGSLACLLCRIFYTCHASAPIQRVCCR